MHTQAEKETKQFQYYSWHIARAFGLLLSRRFPLMQWRTNKGSGSEVWGGVRDTRERESTLAARAVPSFL